MKKRISFKLLMEILNFLIITIAISSFLFPIYAQILDDQSNSQYGKTSFVPGEILVKFKVTPEMKEKLKKFDKVQAQQPNNTKQNLKKSSSQIEKIIYLDIPSIDNLNRKYHVKEMLRVFPKTKLPDKDGYIFIKGVRKKVPDLTTIYKLQVPEDTDILKLVEEYGRDPNVEYAEPNYIYHTYETIPNEYVDRAALAAAQWALDKIKAPEAWDIETGSSNVIISIIDTGVDWDHPDLAANIWTNPGEDPWSDPNDPSTGNGIDDDGNGYVDDWRGWDFVNAPANVVYPGEDPAPSDNNPMDFHGHGTQMAGIAAGVTNNDVGIAGLTWNSQIMVVRAGHKDLNGVGQLDGYPTMQAIYYAASNGAHVISMSFGYTLASSGLRDAINYAYGLGAVLIASAGNDNEPRKRYPAAEENVISVAATDINDRKASFSNFGSWVDIASPGVYIYTTAYNDTYAWVSGTSPSAPYVAGLAALILSKYPGWDNSKTVFQIINTADPIDHLNPDYQDLLGSGRINAYQAVADTATMTSIKLDIVDYSFDEGSNDLDGYINPGETVELFLRIKNISANTLDNVSTVLSSNDNFVTVISNSSAYPILARGDMKYNTSAYSLQIDAGAPEEHTFKLYLEMFSQAKSTIDSVEISTKTPFNLKNWPQSIIDSGTLFSQVSRPVVADLDNDGEYEVLASVWDGRGNQKDHTLHLFDNEGNTSAGWPVNLGDYFGFSPAVGDIDGDGNLEIIVTLNDEAPPSQWIKILNKQGNIIQSWVNSDEMKPYLLTPSLFDVDQDGDLEIFAQGDSLFAWHHDGSVVSGWPNWASQGISSSHDLSPSFGDIDNDGEIEVLSAATAFGDTIWAFNNDGSVVDGWPIAVAETGQGMGLGIGSPLSIGDLDGDGNLEICAFSNGSYVDPSALYVFNSDGSGKIGWPHIFTSETGYLFSTKISPVLADLDLDGQLEVVLFLTLGGPAPQRSLVVLNNDGTVRASWQVLNDGNFPIGVSVADIDDDSEMEIVAGLGIVYLYAWNPDGSVVSGFPIMLEDGFYNLGTVSTDIDRDGDFEIVQTDNENVYVFSGFGSFESSKVEWNGLKHDNMNTGWHGFENVKPQEITDLSATKFGDTIVLQWSPVITDIQGNLEQIKLYKIYRGSSCAFISSNDNLLATTTSTTFTDSEGLGNTSYAVRAIDKYLNVSDVSNCVTITCEPIIAKLIFTTPLRTTIQNETSEIMTIQTQDSCGIPINADVNTVLNLSSTSGAGEFSTAAEPFNPVTSMTISAGNNSVSFYYRDSNVGTPTIIVSENPDQGWTDAQQQTTIEPSITKLAFTTPPRTTLRNDVTQIMTVQRQKSDGTPIIVSSNTTLDLSSTSDAGEFSTTSDPFNPVASVIIPTGGNSVSFYYRDGNVGTPTITASENPDQGWTDGQQQQTVNEPPISQVVFTTPPRTEIPDRVMEIMTIQTQGNDGIPVNVSSYTTINLSSASSTGEFSTQYDPFNPVALATIPAGSNSVSFYYRDSNIGTPRLTAAENPDQGWLDAQQQQTISTSPFIDINSSLTPVIYGSSAWGDYDNDGDLDILLTGSTNGAPTGAISKIYRNDVDNFVDIDAPLEGCYYGSVAWGDYDNDGDLDILLTGRTYSQYISKIYRNDGPSSGSGWSFIDINASLTGIEFSSVAWGDYDNDGDLDILLAGRSPSSGRVSRIYRNDGLSPGSGWNFTDINASLTGVSNSSVRWGDYDNDGDLDILLTGTIGTGNISKVYRNDGPASGSGWSFVDINAPLVGVSETDRSIAWGDYDNDGDLDILMAANTFSGPIAKVYRNDGSASGSGWNFVDINASLTAVRWGTSVAWGDYDNDGDLDILLTGNAGAQNPPTPVTKVYRNDGGNFVDINAPLPGVWVGSSAAWGDYDNDDDLDILLTGNASSESSPVLIAKVYVNNMRTPNTTPTPPTNLTLPGATGNSATLSSPTSIHSQNVIIVNEFSEVCNSVALTWDKSTDSQTAQEALTYNLRLGITPGGSEIVSPLADISNGYRKVPNLGNTNHNNSWTISNLAPGIYYWSVQAIDNAFAGSPFATEQSFTIISGQPPVTNLIFATPPRTTIQNEVSEMITIQTQGPCGTPINVDVNTILNLSSTSDAGEFSTTMDPFNPVTSVAIPAGGNSVSFYYRDGNEGTPTVTASENPEQGWTDGEQQIVIQPPITKLVFTTPQRTTVVNEVTEVMTIQRQSDNGIPVSVSSNTTIDLSTTSGAGEFSVTLDPFNPVTSATIPAGSNLVSFYYMDGTVGTSTLTVSENPDQGWTDAEQQTTIIIEPMITRVAFTSPFRTVVANEVSEVMTIETQSSDGIPRKVDVSTTINLSSTSGAGEFSATSDPFNPVSHLTISAGSDSASFYYRDGNVGTPTITASENPEQGWIDAMQQQQIVSSDPFIHISASLVGVYRSSVAWGDYDSDGDLDILLTGRDSSDTGISKIYRNDGPGSGTGWNFVDINAALTGVYASSVAWGDYDSDGDLDVLLTGYNGSTRISKVYRNDGPGSGPGWSFVDINASLTGVYASSVAWGDYDNDGDLDILLAGLIGYPNGIYEPASHVSKIYRNDGPASGPGWSFVDINASLKEIRSGSVNWGDYDNDGDLDILLTGEDSTLHSNSKIYRNVEGNFADITASLQAVSYSSAAWGDYDDDGDLDILLIGNNLGNFSNVYRNHGPLTAPSWNFGDINASLIEANTGAVAWGDYDNDGDLDVLLTGATSSPPYHASKVYRNDRGSFVDINAPLEGSYWGSVAWGDYDNDGDLDILLTGDESWPGREIPVSKIYQNNIGAPNTVPTAPTNLAASNTTGNSVMLSWGKSTDIQTARSSLTYNLRVGTTPGGSEIVSPMADAGSGYRKVSELGNTNHNNTWTLKNLPGGTYYWSVQAIDNAFAGSEFVSEKTFTILSPVSIEYVFSCQGWYMISLPLIPQDSSVSFLFPDALGGNAYHWNNNTQTYDVVSKLESQKGYWLAIPQATTCSCFGIPLNNFTEHFPSTGWYMIGSVIGQSDFSNPDDNPNGMVLTPAFTWDVNNGCYISANMLSEQNGYWVAVLGQCDLTVSNAAGSSSQPKFTQKKFVEFSNVYGETPPSPPTIDWQTGEILQIPEKFVLRQNYPNPFNPVTNIKFDLPENSLVEIFIYNILGQKVKTLVNNYLQAGNHTIVWNGMNDYDQQLSTGIYLCFIKAGEFKAINKLLLLK